MIVEKGEGWQLICADWRDAGDLPEVDAVIEDPPYGARTHSGQGHKRTANAAGMLSDSGDLGYAHWMPEDVDRACSDADAACCGWIVAMTSHDLIHAYEQSLGAVNRYVFAPLAIVIPGMNVRLQGDGPSNWTIHMMVARRRGQKHAMGTKPGAYTGHTSDPSLGVSGSKPLSLMEAIIRDYSEPGDLVLDRFAGSGTTGVAALRMGRRFVGYERKPEHFDIAVRRLQGRAAHVMGQEDLFA
jgi:site-specific DNA-methyltransferase (adenine-specific)